MRSNQSPTGAVWVLGMALLGQRKNSKLNLLRPSSARLLCHMRLQAVHTDDPILA